MAHLMTVIPARGGSKRIPRKNLALCARRPLIQWTIEAARAADLDPVVSTEDDEITAVALLLGARVLVRPAELARDETTGLEVIQHAAQHAKTKGCDGLVYLQPTSPLRSPDDIRRGIRLMATRDSVVGCDESMIPCGAFWGWSHLNIGELYGGRYGMFVIPHPRSLDVDTPEDLALADEILRGRVKP
jgi:N-acylneuraminate cytidylyltransferase